MNVLINRTDAIGDTLLSTPLARLIKKRNPKARVGFIVSPRSGELIKLCEGIDDVFIFDRSKSFTKNYSYLLKVFNDYNCDTYFHLGGSFFPSFIAWFLRIPFRGGLVSKVWSFIFLNSGMRQSRSKVVKHESEYNLDLAQNLGLLYSNDELSSFRPFFNIDKKLAKKVCSEQDFYPQLMGKKVIIIHPGMSGHTLNWPGIYYRDLIKKLYEYSDDYAFVITYTPSDEAYLKEIRDEFFENPYYKNRLFFLNGATMGLVNFCHFLGNSKLVVAPSTGITHMANALEVSQVAFYSPIKVQSQKRWGPYNLNDNVSVFSPTLGKIDESSTEDFSDNNSMATIEVDTVADECIRLLNKG